MPSLMKNGIMKIGKFFLGAILSSFITAITIGVSFQEAWTCCEPVSNLPTVSASMKLYPSTINAFDTILSNIPDGYTVTNGTYPGWCADQQLGIRFLYTYQVILLSSYDLALPDYLQNSDWDKINYIINHKQGTVDDIQEAIWYFTDDILPSTAEGQAMVDDALMNGWHFCPEPGQVAAVICAILDADGEFDTTVQSSFIEVTVPSSCNGSIGDFVWQDLNNNGIQEDDEPGLDGVTVYLMDDSGTIIATAVTDIGPSGQHGFYQFSNLCAGTYQVEAVTPDGFIPSPSNAPGSTPDDDSNDSPSVVSLSTGDSTDQTIDFGYSQLPFDGCSLGFWKNHVAYWSLTGFKTADSFNEVFDVEAFRPDITLLCALNLGGGGLKKLARQGTAALLNSSHPSVNFPLSTAEVIEAVRDAIVSGEYEPLATQLDDYNNLFCPFDDDTFEDNNCSYPPRERRLKGDRLQHQSHLTVKCCKFSGKSLKGNKYQIKGKKIQSCNYVSVEKGTGSDKMHKCK
ncbi:MAG: SdrD B-like domain-containing protein [bacterium]